MELLNDKGEPMATTNSPGLKVEDDPSFITGKLS